ncbi:MAG: class I SAM-dependent methyltransferase [Gammaproteobacteria bacterium]
MEYISQFIKQPKNTLSSKANNFFKRIVSNHLKSLEESKLSIKINNINFYRKILLEGSLGAAESYIWGYWDTPNLVELIKFFIQKKENLKKLESGFHWPLYFLNTMIYFLKPNSTNNSKKNIKAHYDLSNDFFSLFLDSKMMYSSAIYKDDTYTLEQASEYKLYSICEKVQLKSNDKVLEIGSGWGGFAIYAAKNYGCHVTTITLSQKQYDYVENKIKDLNLENKIKILFKDYREVEGEFDKIVSIEMLEAVGHKYYPSYFKTIDRLLRHKGFALIQVITIEDQQYNRAKHEVDFIKKFIFPGSCIPSLTALCDVMTENTQLRILDVKDIGLDYAKTLLDWRDNFFKRVHDVKKMGFTDEFIRMWNFYLCYSVAGFETQYLSDLQLFILKR